MWLMFLGLIVLLAWFVFTVRSLPGLTRSVALPQSDAESTSLNHTQTRSQIMEISDFPQVSVVIAARNEAGNLDTTLASLKQQSWPNLQIIVVNDRSTDETGKVLEEAKQSWPGLVVMTIDSLPLGWLGKTHALQEGAKAATGKWLLFTDADVTFSKNAIETAIQYAHCADADHLALAPGLIAHGFWLRATVYFFLYNVVLVFRPQDADRPHTQASVGIGAFNLVKRTVYEAVDGHQRVALNSDDDLALGKQIKLAGFKQIFAGGTQLLRVEWYRTLGEMTRGLEKNAMAPFQFRFWRFTLGIISMIVFYVYPVIGLGLSMLFASPLLSWQVPFWPLWLASTFFGISFLLEMLLFHMTRRYSGIPFWWAFTIPFAACILATILIRAAILCAVRGGMQWRGTFYSLKELRKVKR